MAKPKKTKSAPPIGGSFDEALDAATGASPRVPAMPDLPDQQGNFPDKAVAPGMTDPSGINHIQTLNPEYRMNYENSGARYMDIPRPQRGPADIQGRVKFGDRYVVQSPVANQVDVNPVPPTPDGVNHIASNDVRSWRGPGGGTVTREALPMSEEEKRQYGWKSSPTQEPGWTDRLRQQIVRKMSGPPLRNDPVDRLLGLLGLKGATMFGEALEARKKRGPTIGNTLTKKGR